MEENTIKIDDDTEKRLINALTSIHGLSSANNILTLIWCKDDFENIIGKEEIKKLDDFTKFLRYVEDNLNTSKLNNYIMEIYKNYMEDLVK